MAIRLSTLRPLSGSSCTARLPTTVPTDALCVCSSGDSPTTVSVSVRFPTCSVTSTRGVDAPLAPVAPKTLKAGQLDFQAVHARYQIHESKGAIVGADGIAPIARRGVNQYDTRA